MWRWKWNLEKKNFFFIELKWKLQNASITQQWNEMHENKDGWSLTRGCLSNIFWKKKKEKRTNRQIDERIYRVNSKNVLQIILEIFFFQISAKEKIDKNKKILVV